MPKKNASKSDEVLAQQLEQVTGTPPKKNVTFAEAQAEAAALDALEGQKPTTEAKRAAKTVTKKVDADGNEIIKTPRPKIAPGSAPSAVLAAHITDEALLHTACVLSKGDTADAAQAKTVMGVIDKLAKKVAEKAVNLIRHRSNPSSIQVYTRIGMDMLLRDGVITSKGLVDKLQATKYTIGTARSQANQIMLLFPALQVATATEKGTIALNKDSVIVRDYRNATKG